MFRDRDEPPAGDLGEARSEGGGARRGGKDNLLQSLALRDREK